jgi:hypothetical protein
MSGRPAMTPARLLTLARRATLLLALGGGAWLWTRLGTLSLPEEGCSPLLRFSPGVRLWIDWRPAEIAPGDAVLFRGGPGELLLGLVRERREDALWIETDAPDCPGRDSRSLGWIPRADLRGRVLVATRF